MLPIERLTRIKELVTEKGNIKITELSEYLNVSEMTIHRDVKKLVDEGFVIKTFGGISLAKQLSPTHFTDDTCTCCQRAINERFLYQIMLTNNHIERTCCAHCGLLRQVQ